MARFSNRSGELLGLTKASSAVVSAASSRASDATCKAPTATDRRWFQRLAWRGTVPPPRLTPGVSCDDPASEGRQRQPVRGAKSLADVRSPAALQRVRSSRRLSCWSLASQPAISQTTFFAFSIRSGTPEHCCRSQAQQLTSGNCAAATVPWRFQLRSSRTVCLKTWRTPEPELSGMTECPVCYHCCHCREAPGERGGPHRF
jgi:hypothetical protein